MGGSVAVGVVVAVGGVEVGSVGEVGSVEVGSGGEGVGGMRGMHECYAPAPTGSNKPYPHTHTPSPTCLQAIIINHHHPNTPVPAA